MNGQQIVKIVNVFFSMKFPSYSTYNYAFMCVCVRTCMHVCVRVCVCACMHACICPCACVCMCAYVYVCMCVHACVLHIRMHMCLCV